MSEHDRPEDDDAIDDADRDSARASRERAAVIGAGGRRSRPALVIAIALLVGGAGVLAYLLVFAGGGTTEAGDPRAAVRLFYEGLRTGECEKSADVIDPEGVGRAEHRDQVCDSFGDLRAAFGSLVGVTEVTDESPSRAVILAQVSLEDETRRWIFRATKRDGAWRLSGGGGACLDPSFPEDRGVVRLSAGERPRAGTYSSNPPTSGPATEEAAEAGKIYPANPGVPELVRHMELGGIVVWHNGLEREDAAGLESVAEALFGQGYRILIMTPYEELKVPIAVTAWGTLLECGGVDAEEIAGFADQHYGSGPEGEFACAQSRVLAGVTPPACET